MALMNETWQHCDLITNGIRMHYVRQEGALSSKGLQAIGSRPLIVLLHGFPEYWYSWRYQIPFLADQGYTVIAPDLRGYNDSDKPRKGYDIPTLLKDIEGLIKDLGQEKAIIVGHDWGGVLAWSFAIHYPQMTERLIVLNAPHPMAMLREMRTFKQLRRSWYVFVFQLPWLPEFILLRNAANAVGSMLNGAAIQKSAFPPEITLKFQAAMLKPGAMTAALNYYRQLVRHFPVYSKGAKTIISTPTLLIWGEQDIALGLELTSGLEQWVKNIQVKRIAESGHWVQQEQPEMVNNFIQEFLQES